MHNQSFIDLNAYFFHEMQLLDKEIAVLFSLAWFLFFNITGRALFGMEGNHPPSSSRIKCQPSFVCNKKFDGEGMKAVAEPGRTRG